jgi:hypothetical protein
MMNRKMKPVKKALGGLIKKIGDLFFDKATTRVKNFLRDHGEDKITSLTLGRTPIGSALNGALNLVSSGKFDEAKQKEGFDKFFHTFLIINDKFKMEKNQTLNVDTYKSSEKEENKTVSVPSNLTINDLFKKGIARMGEDDFYSNYSALDKNCQWLMKNLMKSIGRDEDKFLYQDVTNIKKEIEGTSNIADEITDGASTIDKFISWLSGGKLGLRRGGRSRIIGINGFKKKKLF